MNTLCLTYMGYHVQEKDDIHEAITQLLSSDMARILFNLDIISADYFWNLNTYDLFVKL